VDLVFRNRKLKNLFFVYLSQPMAEAGTPEELARLAVDSLRQARRPSQQQQQSAANMSRRRFICVQTNSIIVAVLTLLTVGAVTLSRITDFKEFLFSFISEILSSEKNHTTFPKNLSLSL
jgi:hypothetical protein